MVEFKFDPRLEIDEEKINNKTLCFLHLKIDDYKGDLMSRGSDGVYRIRRMLPPKNVEYYYSVSDTPLSLKSQKEFGSTFLSN